MEGQFDIGAISPSRYFFAIASLLGLLFAFIAPSTDGAWGLVLNIVQWQLQTVVPMALILICHLRLARLAKFEALSPWSRLLVSGILGALLFSPVALWLDSLFAAEPSQEAALIAWINELVSVAPPVVICWLAINTPWVLGLRLQSSVDRDREQKPRHAARDDNNAGSGRVASFNSADAAAHLNWPYMALLPQAIRDKPVYLKAELHYLLVVTPKGRSLILYNLSDAIKEMGEGVGYQPHRSYWVARDAAIAFIRKSRQGELLLGNGDSIPVSRRKVEFVSALQLNADQAR